jgi:acetyltransferase
MFAYMAQFAENLKSLYETPTLHSNNGFVPDKELANQIIQRARQTGRTILTEYESKQLLSAYGIPTVETRIATSAADAVQAAAEIGYPVVLKLHSETVTHKTDVGGVRLDLADEAAVREAYNGIRASVAEKAGAEHFLGVTVQPMSKLEGYELILGSSIDPQFGPVLLFGLGGQLVEVFKDRTLGLPPLNTTLARRMMERTRIYQALKGVRGRQPVDMQALEQLMVHFSQLVAEQPWIKELDINPLLASPERLLALDARVVIYEAEVSEASLPALAIRPYPEHYVTTWKTHSGLPVTIRPVRPEDELPLVKFHETLSDRTVYLRYLGPVMLDARVAHDRLARICHCDYDREITLVVEHEDKKKGETIILGAGRLSKLHCLDEARFSILVSDHCQGLGLGRELLRRLIDVAREEKIYRMEAIITPDNEVMRKLTSELGFTLSQNGNGEMVKAELML